MWRDYRVQLTRRSKTMDEQIRRLVAYAAAGRASGRFGSSVYSYDRAKHSNMSETYDYESAAHLGNVKSGQMFHYGLSAHVSLEVTGNSLKGYDYSSSSHFSGRIMGRTVEVYDYGESRYFSYSV
jgi:hypothetical protein